MKPLKSALFGLSLMFAGAAQAGFPPCTAEDFELFSLYDAAAMNSTVPAQQLRTIFAEQYGMTVGELNQLHSRCNYALSARFITQEEWNVFYRESLGKLKAFCTKDMKPVYCEEAMAAHGPQ